MIIFRPTEGLAGNCRSCRRDVCFMGARRRPLSGKRTARGSCKAASAALFGEPVTARSGSGPVQGSTDGWSMTQRQYPSGWERATSTVVPLPGGRVEVSAISPLMIAGCCPADSRDGLLARNSARSL
jgi:hypothetical protein